MTRINPRIGEPLPPVEVLELAARISDGEVDDGDWGVDDGLGECRRA